VSVDGLPEPANIVRAGVRRVLELVLHVLSVSLAPTRVPRMGYVALTWFALSAFALPVAAEETRVLLVYPEVPSPLLGEALVHVRGELGSLGLSIQVTTTAAEERDFKPELSPGTYGALVFEERPGVLILRAYHPGSAEPTTQQLATQDGRITPHVAGVRAVETLRAALQQYYYSAQHPVPDSVKKLARIEEPPPRPEPPPPPPVRPPSAPPPPPGASKPPSPLGVELLLAPRVQFDILNARTAGAASLGVGAGSDWWLVAAELASTLIPFEVRAEPGSARLHRHAAALEFRGRWRLSEALALFAELGAGPVVYRMQGTATAGHTANDDNHWTAFGVAGVGAEYWVGSHVGLFLEGESSAALNAPYVRFSGDPGERFERPLRSFALGVMVGFMR